MNQEINKFEYISSVSESERETFSLPTRSSKYSAGYDIHTPQAFVLEPGESIQLNLKIKARIKSNEVLLIVPRSSVGFKYGIQLWNTTGVIDSDYYNNPDNEGCIHAKLINNGLKVWEVNVNDRILQAIFVRYDITEDDEATQQRNGGIGSTGV